MIGEEKVKVNLTLEIEKSQVIKFENWLRSNLIVYDFKIMPNTDELYENDKTFQMLSKAVKKARDARDKYINDKL